MLSHGKTQFLGETQKAIDTYRESVFDESQAADGKQLATAELAITDVEFLNAGGERSKAFPVGAPLRIRVHYEAQERIDEWASPTQHVRDLSGLSENLTAPVLVAIPFEKRR